MGGGTDWFVNQPFAAGGVGGAVSPPGGGRAEPRKQTHFGKNILKSNLKSGRISVARPGSYKYVHILVSLRNISLKILVARIPNPVARKN